MIRYTLVCAAGPEKSPPETHEFESWFPSSDAFEEQVRRGLVACPICDSVRVSKAVMAPNLSRTRKNGAGRAAPAADGPAREVALADPEMRRLNAMARDLRDQILEKTRDVGAAFPEEARRMRAGETQEAPIRGQASPEEARALLEEGISILPLPILPEDRN